MSKKLLWYVILGLFCCSAFAYVATSQGPATAGSIDYNKIAQTIATLEPVVAAGKATPEQVAFLAELRAMMPTSSASASAPTQEKALPEAVKTETLTSTPISVKGPGTGTKSSQDVSSRTMNAVPSAADLASEIAAKEAYNRSLEVSKVDEAVIAEKAYQTYLETGRVAPEYKALIYDRIVAEAARAPRSPLDDTGGPDAYGYTWYDNTNGGACPFYWTELCGDANSTNLPLTDDGTAGVTLGFTFPFYGGSSNLITVGNNGGLAIGTLTGYVGYSYVALDDFNTDGLISVFQSDLGTGNLLQGCDPALTDDEVRYRNYGADSTVIEWKKQTHYYESTDLYSFEVTLYPSGNFRMAYNGTDWFNGTSGSIVSTIGVDAPMATGGDLYLADGLPATRLPLGDRAVCFTPPLVAPSGRCCYGDPGAPTCGIETQAECLARIDAINWTIGVTDCIANPCDIYGRCCYSSPYSPLCAFETEAVCLARADVLEWTVGVDCSTPCEALPCAANETPIADAGVSTGTTCGNGDNYSVGCLGSYFGGEEGIIEWTVTNTGWYTVGVVTPDSWVGIVVTTDCEGTLCLTPPAMATGSAGSQTIACREYIAGTYYIIIDTYPSPYCITNFTVTTAACVPPPSGKCCYGDPVAPSCEFVTQATCLARTDEFSWTVGVDCTLPCDPIPTGRCCYGDDPWAPTGCSVLTEAACLALYNDLYWIEGEDCTAPCESNCPTTEAVAATCELAITLTVPVVRGGDITGGALVPATVPYCGSTLGGNAVWYKVVGTGNTMTASMCDNCNEFDSVVRIYTCTVNGCDNLTCVAGNDYGSCVNSSAPNPARQAWCSILGQEYYVVVGGYYTTDLTGRFTVAISDDGVPCTGAVDCTVGRCCYGDPWTHTCAENTASACTALAGEWVAGETCITLPCVDCTVAPANDVCDAVAPGALDDVTPLVYGEDMSCALVNDCADPTLAIVWESFTTMACYDVTLSYQGSDGQNVGYVYIVLFTDCECVNPYILYTTIDWSQGDFNPIMTFKNLPAGTYYQPVHPDRGPNYSLTISATACEVARCCYLDELGDPQCEDNTILDCNVLGGAWTSGMTCTVNPCPTGKCCYGPPLAPLCNVETQAECLARTDDQSWAEGQTCATACPVLVQGETCAFPFALTVPGAFTGTTVGFVNDYAYNSNTSPDVVYSYTPPVDQQVTLSLCGGSTWDTYLYVYDNACSGTPLYFDDDLCDPGLQSELVCVALLAGHTYYVIVDGFSLNSGAYTLNASECVPCPVECPPEGIAEGEPDCFNGYVDATNGGCNFTPNVFGAIDCNQTICGTTGAWGSRDTDWYLLTLTEPMNITWEVSGDFSKTAVIYQAGTTTLCSGYTQLSYVTAARCITATATASALNPGNYLLFAAPSVYSGVACGTPYLGVLTCTPYVPPVGRCCYDGGASCQDNMTQFVCSALAGSSWSEGLDCTTPCAPLPPCPISFSDCADPDEYIANVNFNLGAINNTSIQDCPNHYGNYSYLTAQAEPGVGYPLDITVFNTNGGWTQYVSVLIDWNLNNTWDLATELTNVGSLSFPMGTSNVFSTMVNVPVDAVEGMPYMRVITREFSYTLTGCDVATYGEAEDYRLVVGPTECDPIENLTVIREAGQIVLNWTVLQETTHRLYYTTNPNNDGNPDAGADPDFSVINMVPDPLPVGPASYSLPDTAVVTKYYNFVIAAEDCGPPVPVGRCCYGDPVAPSCVVETNAECIARTDDLLWSFGLTCITDCPVVPVGRCCYGTPATPSCIVETNAACIARADDISWSLGLDCNTDCPIAGQGETVAFPFPITALPFLTSGSTVGFVNDYDATCPYSGSTAPDVVYSYTPAATQTVTISLCTPGTTTDYDTKVFVYQNVVATPPYACNDDMCSSPLYDDYVSLLTALTFTGGNTYYIVVDGYGGNSGNYTLNVTTP